MSTLKFGKRERLAFIGCGPLDKWKPAQGPALYALTYKQNESVRPNSHTVIYFGESDDLANPTVHHSLLKWWNESSGVRGDLFVFIHPMPGSSQDQRRTLTHQLALEYEPHGNN